MTGAKNTILEAVGGTPIVKLQKLARHVTADIYVKCEYLNPGGSMKDRVARNIVTDAERRGLLGPGGTIVEATSGNTGMGLALVAALRGYSCVFVMPDKMSPEKVAGLRAFGARVVICPTAVEPEDPRSYYQTAKRIVAETPGAFYANQYHNPANPDAHYTSTAPEIWEQTNGEVDVFVAGMGTGGTISGCGRFFKEKKPGFRLVGVDPIGSLYYEFVKTGRMTRPFAYYVEGIGEDFLPTTMNLKLVDEIVRVDDKECFLMTRELVRQEGLFVGGSSGAAVAGAIKYAEATKRKENILVLLPDGAQKYLSKIFDDKWMRENGFLDEPDPLGTVGELLRRKKQRTLITAKKGESVREVIASMRDTGFSQLPVLEKEGGRLAGIVAESDLLDFLVKGEGGLDAPIDTLVESDYATVSPATRVHLLRNIFNDAKMVVVESGDTITGVITKIDLIEFLAERRA
ncbi:MAG TPA: cystathionine beta-synthase [Polyangia bacterium]|nr:cystathionine beta-synthase [Polyangia bacterium]